MKSTKKMAAIAVSVAMLAACGAPATSSGDGLTNTTLGDAEVGGMVVMDAQTVNDLLAEFNAMRTEVQGAASPGLTDAWNALEIQMANMVVSADSGGVPQSVMDEARDAVQSVTAAIQAEGDSVTESLTAGWNAFVDRFQMLTS